MRYVRMARGTRGRLRRHLLIMLLFLGLAGIYSLYGMLAPVTELTGPFRAVDGDTLTHDGLRLRIRGIDAPERRQLCGAAGKRWPCGLEAGRVLGARLDGLRCEMRGLDKYRRRLAVCRTPAGDLGAEMVRLGYAVAYGRYAAEEAEARAARRGIWSGPFERPQDWRKAHRPQRAAVEEAAPLDFLRSWWYGSSNGGDEDDEAL